MQSYQGIFGTDGIRAHWGEFPLLEKEVVKIAALAGQLLIQKSPQALRQILIARDPRFSGSEIESALCQGFAQSGIEVLLCGVVPTAATSAMLMQRNILGGVVISASHNPPEFNGIKFFTPQGKKWSESWERELENQLQNFSSQFQDFSLLNSVSNISASKDISALAHQEYIDFLFQTLPQNFKLQDQLWVVDCANGASSSFVQEIFERLSARLFLLNASPDGNNINLNCGALHPETLQQKVVELGASGGFALDGDADRVQFVDDQGQLMDGDVLIAMLAQHYCAQKRLPVVTTVMANLGFMQTMQNWNVPVITTAVGDRAVWQAMEKSGAILGGEQSGHIIFSSYLPTGDGLLTALQVLKVLFGSGQKLSYFRQVVPKFPQLLLNLKVAKKKQISDCPDLQNTIATIEKEFNGQGRILVRYSGTEPLLRIMVEGSSLSEVERLAQLIAESAQKNLEVLKSEKKLL